MTDFRFIKGQRVMLSDKAFACGIGGKRRNKGPRGSVVDWNTRMGTIKTNTRGICAPVVWDGNPWNSTNTLHHTFLRKVDES